jgi:glycerol kinase
LDAIAFQVADVLEAMEKAAAVKLPALLADGGATRNDTLMQLQADMIGRPVYRSVREDLSACGAAMLAGQALGWWTSLGEFAALPRHAQEFKPMMRSEDRERLRANWTLAVRRARLRAEAGA